jgi:hypothetical protein
LLAEEKIRNYQPAKGGLISFYEPIKAEIFQLFAIIIVVVVASGTLRFYFSDMHEKTHPKHTKKGLKDARKHAALS